MKWFITPIEDLQSEFIFQALIQVKGARPFQSRSGKVLQYPGADRDTIFLGTKKKEELDLIIQGIVKGLEAYKRAIELDDPNYKPPEEKASEDNPPLHKATEDKGGNAP